MAAQGHESGIPANREEECKDKENTTTRDAVVDPIYQNQRTQITSIFILSKASLFFASTHKKWFSHSSTQVKYHSNSPHTKKKCLGIQKPPNMTLTPQGHESAKINSLGCDTLEFKSQKKSRLKTMELPFRFIHVLA